MFCTYCLKCEATTKPRVPNHTIYLTTIAGPWHFWKGIRTSKAHKPVTLSGNATFTKV